MKNCEYCKKDREMFIFIIEEIIPVCYGCGISFLLQQNYLDNDEVEDHLKFLKGGYQ